MIDPTISAYYTGDCRKLLKQLPAGCVRTCITSPPFWGLRDYGHKRQIGLEPTPEAYVRVLVEVFDQVRRVLAEDGTLWLNLGDCYAGSRTGPQGKSGARAGCRDDHRGMMSRTKGIDPKNPRKGSGSNDAPNRWRHAGIKPKDLVGVPWMTAFALREAGWYLRMDNIWAKPNPMPESVTDRPTKAHEYMFLFAKNPSYYYNGAAIAEPVSWAGQNRTVIGPYASAMPGAPPHTGLRKYKSGNKERKPRADHGGVEGRGTNQPFGVPWTNTDDTRNKRSVWEVPGEITLEYAQEQARLWSDLARDWIRLPQKPSVWTVAPQPYRGAHFATFPPTLIEPCVLAGSEVGDLVLDPFFGTGTTGEVAEKYERRWIGLDINPDYAKLAKERTAQRSLPLSRSQP